jgi:hypothetical protein
MQASVLAALNPQGGEAKPDATEPPPAPPADEPTK